MGCIPLPTRIFAVMEEDVTEWKFGVRRGEEDVILMKLGERPYREIRICQPTGELLIISVKVTVRERAFWHV